MNMYIISMSVIFILSFLTSIGFRHTRGDEIIIPIIAFVLMPFLLYAQGFDGSVTFLIVVSVFASVLSRLCTSIIKTRKAKES